MKPTRFAKPAFWIWLPLSLIASCSAPPEEAEPEPSPTSLDLPGERAYPESLTSTSDGTIYVSSIAEGGVIRLKDGKSDQFIKPGDFGTASFYGIFADEHAGTLWACSNPLPQSGGTGENKATTALVAFDLKTGAGKATVPFPSGGRASCNDMAQDKDGALYVSDTAQPRVLRLAAGSDSFEVWATDPRFQQGGAGLDGIAFGDDGDLYVNTLGGSFLFRIAVEGGKAGLITQLELSQPVSGADGMRHEGGNRFLMVDDRGVLSRVTIDGDTAKLETLRDGLADPTGITIIGDTAWVAEGQLSLLFDPAKKGQPPTLPFKLQAVPLLP